MSGKTDCEEKRSSSQDNEVESISENPSVSIHTRRDNSKEINNLDSWNETENWRGLNDNIQNKTTTPKQDKITNLKKLEYFTQRKSKATYLDDYPDWNHTKSDHTVGIPILKNGSLCKTICIKNVYFIIRETCAFDSILQIAMFALASYNEYKNDRNK